MQLFSHLEGIVIAPTIETLSRNKIIDTLIDIKRVSLSSISVSKNVQSGYINVALNSLASLGVLEKKLKSNDTIYTLTDYGTKFLKHIDNYNFYSKIKNHLNNFIINYIKEKDINKKFPRHQIIGEELGHKKSMSDFSWVIDPIDGTRDYIKKKNLELLLFKIKRVKLLV